jgi:outer membrane autotransporter protein
LYDFLTTVYQANAWDQLIDSANGDNISALAESDRVVGNYIQRQLASSSGLNSGDEAAINNGLWLQALYSKGEQDLNGETQGFESDTTAIALGYGRDLNDNLTVGAGISYSETEVDGNSGGEKLESEYVSLLAYGQYQHQDWFANAVISYGQASNDDQRQVVSEQLSANYDSESFTIRGQLGHDFSFDNGIVLSPRGELRYNYISVDGYEEKGGTYTALAVDSQSYDVVEFGAGLMAAKAFQTQYGLFTPHLDAGIYYDTKGDAVQMSSRFIAGGPGFIVEGEEPDQTSFTTTAGVDWDVNDQHSLRLDYQYFGNGDFSSNSLMAKYHYAF